MTLDPPADERDSPTLAFDEFWTWLMGHANCVLRAGTSECILYDDEDVHWHFAAEGPDTLVVQLIRGKRLSGELFIQPEAVSYVQGYAGDQEGEFVFELVAETESDHTAAYFFVLTHAYDAPETPSGRAVH